jgi:hypothetical protein
LYDDALQLLPAKVSLSEKEQRSRDPGKWIVVRECSSLFRQHLHRTAGITLPGLAHLQTTSPVVPSLPQSSSALFSKLHFSHFLIVQSCRYSRRNHDIHHVRVNEDNFVIVDIVDTTLPLLDPGL